jgi:tRNA threonylcarbamoyladenosine biosynthesis protein TsaB
MKVLAVDTSSERGSVALVDGAHLLGEVRLRAADRHSRLLLGAVDLLLRAADLEARQLEGFAVVAGPGSFTGLRVGISTVQGLALAAGRPCLGASALELLAVSAGVAPPIVVLRDAFRGEAYWAAFGPGLAATSGPCVGRLEEALGAAPPGAAFVGDLVSAQRASIEERTRDPRFPSGIEFLAAPLALWAEPRLGSGEGVGPQELRPLYLRGADIRRASA